MYYLIFIDDQGELNIVAHEKEELEKRLTMNYYGNLSFQSPIKAHQSDPQHWGKNNALLIKGAVIIPEKTVKVS